MKDKQRIAELEALLRRPRAKRTAVSLTPVPTCEADSRGTSFATPRGSATSATAALREVAAPLGLAENMPAYLGHAAEATGPHPVHEPEPRLTIVGATLSPRTFVFRT
eukprot:15059561-Heterocapsa_arctica.AAC.1